MGGALIRTWTSFAPARRSSPTICLVVVPRTIESSTTISRLSRTISRRGESLTLTPRWRIAWEGWMNVRPLYRLRTMPSRYGIPDASANPAAAGAPVSGHGHHEVRARRVLRRELHAHPAPGLVQVAALHVGVRPGEVDELEDAQGRRRLGVADGDRLPAGLEDHDLAGLHVAHELGAHDVERRGLRGEDPAAGVVAPQPGGVTAGEREPAEDERPEPVRVADADDALLVEDDEAEGAAHPGQDAAQGVDRVLGRLVGEERGQELRVGAGGETAAPPWQLLQQLAGVDQVPVVADGERPARPQAQRGLGVLPDRGAGGRVPAVGDREVARERRDPPLVEDLADHAQVLVDHQVGPVRDADTRRLLAPVLEREQRRRGHGRRLVTAVGQDDPDDAAHQPATSAPGSAASAT